MILLFTDFGWDGPYVGQMKAVLQHAAPGTAVIDLMHDAPVFNPRAAAYLLASFTPYLPADSVVLAVVDPGVGDEARRPVIMNADGRWYVGPDNGLFNVIAGRAGQVEFWEILWRPETLSKSFHGRDLFAPVAAALAKGEIPPSSPLSVEDIGVAAWPAESAEIIYLDSFGNAMTGLWAESVSPKATIEVHGRSLHFAETFSRVPVGTGFWYANANGLVEIAVNQGSAAAVYELALGDKILIHG